MARRVALVTALVLTACAGVERPPPAGAPATFSGDAREAAVGAPMVDARSTAVRVDPATGQSRVAGVHAEFVYLGFLGGEGAGKRTIRIRYEERRIKDGVENEVPDHRAEVRLDLSQGNVVSYRGWSIGIVEATDVAVRYVASQGPEVR